MQRQLKICRFHSNISANEVLSETNRERTVKLLKSLKPVNKFGRMNSNIQAAVLVPLCTVNREVSLLLTVRSMNLRNNRGQVAFPGGMKDDSDRSLEETAIRETFEEVGLDRRVIDIWGKGPSIGRMDMMVTPFLAYVGEIDVKNLNVNPNEVERAFCVSLEDMCDPAIFKTTHFRSKEQSYRLPAFCTQSFRIWGLTALITHTILKCLLPEKYGNQVQLEVLTSKTLPSMKNKQKR